MIAAIGVTLYLGVMVGCWVKIAADYRYDMIRDRNGGDWSSRTMRDTERKEHAFWHSVWAVFWPTRFPVWAWQRLFAFAGLLGERRAALEDAAIDALKDEAVALKKTRDLFERGSDEWRLLDSVAVEARAKWQEAQR